MSPTLALLAACLLAAPTLRAAELKVMTYNLRYASDTGPDRWEIRRPLVRDCIQQQRPDLIGTQEGLAPQLADIQSDLPGYGRLGKGREAGGGGEHMAIFFLESRLELRGSGDFWLSDTPAIPGSRSWGNHHPRMLTWARFLDRTNQREFVLLNTHLDHQSQESRLRSAALIHRHLATLPAELPALLVGDFNAVARANPVHAQLLEGGFLADLFLGSATRRNAELDTFNGFRAATRGGRHIDWILGRGPWQPLEAEVVDFSRDGRFPSDHFPVAVRLKLN